MRRAGSLHQHGNEAVSFALRLARAYRERDTILKFEGGLHGVGDYAQYSITPKGEARLPAHAMAESVRRPRRCWIRRLLVAPFNDLETTAGSSRSTPSELAAVCH